MLPLGKLIAQVGLWQVKCRTAPCSPCDRSRKVLKERFIVERGFTRNETEAKEG
jgi:hypothetical protein